MGALYHGWGTATLAAMCAARAAPGSYNVPFRVPVPPSIRDRIDRLEIPFNRYGIDPYGTDRAFLAQGFSIYSWLYHRYFDMSVYGIEHIPPRGRAMLISNHSGGYALDASLIVGACFYEPEQPRLAQGMAEKFLNTLPFSSTFTNRAGMLVGLPDHAERLLSDERLLMVFPEGARGTAKLYKDRNSLVRFGTGFMRLALQTKTPIVPVAFVGAGEAIPTIHNSYTLGKILGVPYVPFTPYLLPLPRPTNCQIYFAPPISFDGDGSEDDQIIHGYVNKVKQTISRMIELGVERRHSGNLDAPIDWDLVRG